MTADEARERLEAAIRRAATYVGNPGQRKCAVTENDMARILAAADFYAEQYADEVLAHLEAEYAGPARLAVAAAEAFERKSNG